MQQASYLVGGPLLWILPLFLHVNKKSDEDDDDDDDDNDDDFVFTCSLFCVFSALELATK